MGADVNEEIRAKFPRGYMSNARQVLKAGKLDLDGKPKANGTVVTDPEVVSILNTLIHLDIAATEKIGKGISHWVVYSNRDLMRNSTGYRIMRVDGTGPITFGYLDVLHPPSAKSFVQRALNDEAAELMVEFRKERFRTGPVYCRKTGVLIEDFLNAKAVHVDPKLSDLHEAFLRSEGLSIESVGLVKQSFPRGGYLLEDRELAARWVEFQKGRLDGVDLEWMERYDR